MMVNTVFTIGYSGFSINDFIKTLILNKINLVVDVRSQPYSKHYFEFNREDIELRLKNNGIHYRNYAKEFGARQDDKKFYTCDGYLDFELFAKSDYFLQGIDKLKKSMDQNYLFVLMCAEKDPINCHRTILIARAFHNSGYNVVHILPGNKRLSQNDIEKCLLLKYFPNRNQLTLFDEKWSEQEYINKAYQKRNAEIGYSIKEEDE